jgi:hypothetical protein
MAKPDGKSEGKIRYKYLGVAPWILDSVSGSATVWKGQGDIQAMPEAFAEDFEKSYAPYFERLDPLVEVPDEVVNRRVPQGTPYSHLNLAQLREEYTRRIGYKPHAKLPPGEIIAQIVNIDALEQGRLFQEEVEAELAEKRAK